MLEITKENFDTEVLLEMHRPVLLAFWSETDTENDAQQEILRKLQEKYGTDLKVGTVHVEEQIGIAFQYQVMSTPTLVLMHLGMFVNRKNGLTSEDEIEGMLDELRSPHL